MPVGRPQVSIRLGTTGRSDVEKDFAAIGDSGEAQAKRYQASWERASAAAEAALEKQAKAAARLDAVRPTSSGATNLINPITGGSYAQSDGRAQASAAAIASSYNQAEAAARRLLASVDPLYAAQMRYDSALQEAIGLQKIGALSTAQLATVQTGLKNELDGQVALYGKQGAAIGNTRIAQMELMHVVRGSVDQYAAGAAPMQIFTMHLGMIGQAAAMSGASLGKVGAFMASGWGLAATVAAVALAPLIGKLFETGTEVDDLVEKLKKEARDSADNNRAHQIFATTLEGVNDALRRNQQLLDTQGDKEESAAHKALAAAIAAKAHAEALQAETKALLDNADAQVARDRSMLTSVTSPEGRDFAAQNISTAQQRVDQLRANLALTAADIRTADQQITDAMSHMAVEVATRDPIDRIKRHYDGLIESTRKRLVAEHATTEEIVRQTKALKAQEDAAIKAEQERNRKGPANAGGTAIFNEQIASFFDTAAKYRGLSEHKAGDRSVLESFFKEANQNLDPEKTAWCAAFVNAVLAANGVKGTGSLAAKSFLTFGKDDTKSPQRGDIGVVRTKVGDHVGFVDSVDKAGNVKLLAGNTGDKVAEATYSKSQVLAIRRPPTPSEAATAAERATSDALQAQMAFDGESQRLNQQYLQALSKVIAGYDAQASVQLMRAQGEHDAEAKEIDANLAAGKYGDATSQLAQTRAQQLREANDGVLSERKAAIALDSYVKSLQAQDATNERETQFKLDGLEYQKSIALTTAARRRLADQIIDIEYQEKERHLQYLLALDKLLGNTEDAAKVAAELAHLPEEKKRDQGRAANDNKTPFEAYRDDLNKEWADVGGTIQNDVVGALKSLDQSLADALLKSKNFHDLWKNMKSVAHDFAATLLKDLLELAIRMMIIRPLMNAIGGGGGGFATGTEYAPGGVAMVGEHGPELVNLPRGSKVNTAASTRRILAANDSGPMIGSLTINGDFRGADPLAVAAIGERLNQMQDALPGQIVATMNDARTRFVWRR